MIAKLDHLLRLWEAKRGGDAMPVQSAFGAEDLRPWLPNVALIEVHAGPKRFFYRLAGTALVTRYGVNFTGRWLEDLRIPDSPGYWEQQYALTAAEKTPRLGAVPQFDADYNQRSCSWLMLPLIPDLAPRGGPGPIELVILACVQFNAA